MYKELDWVVHQVGLGRFKAAEALSAVLLNHSDLSEKVVRHNTHAINTHQNLTMKCCSQVVDHPTFLKHMWGIVVNSSGKTDGTGAFSGNGDHCELLGAVCIKNGSPQKSHQDILHKLVETDLKTIWTRYETRLRHIWPQEAQDDQKRLAMDSERLQPTSEIFFASRLLEMVARMGLANDAIKAYISDKLFKGEAIHKALFSEEMPSFVRKGFATLVLMFQLDSHPELPVTAGARMHPNALKAISTNVDKTPDGTPDGTSRPTNTDGFAFSLDLLKNRLLEYLKEMGERAKREKVDLSDVESMAPYYRNLLNSSIFEIMHRLLLQGAFAAKDDMLADGNILLGNEVRELVEILIEHLMVHDDAGDKSEKRRLRPGDERAKTVMKIKQQILQTFSFCFKLWQSSRVDVIVKAFCTTVDKKQLAHGSKRDSALEDNEAGTEIHFENPSRSVDVFENDWTESRLDEKRDSADSTATIRAISSACVDALDKNEENLALLDTKSLKKLVEALQELTIYEFVELRVSACQLLFEATMHSKGMLDMLAVSTLIVTGEDAKRFQFLRQNVMDFESQFDILVHSGSGDPGRDEAIKICTNVADELIKSCDGVDERPFRLIMADMEWPERLLSVLNLGSWLSVSKDRPTEPESELICKCLTALGAMCDDVSDNQNTVARTGLIENILPVLFSSNHKIQIFTVECISQILKNNKALCVLHIHLVVSKVTAALQTRLDNDRAAMKKKDGDSEASLELWRACLELLPVLMKSSHHEIYQECTLPVAKALARELNFLDLTCTLKSQRVTEALRETGNQTYPSRKQMIADACSGERVRHCDAAAEVVMIYIASLNALSICAAATVSSEAELLCQQLLPLDECMGRLSEIVQLESEHCKNDHEIFVQLKRALCGFTDGVYADTDVVQLRQQLRQPGNGLWMADDGTEEEPKSIMRLILSDLRHLYERYKEVHEKAVADANGNKAVSLKFYETDGVKRICPFLHEYCFGVAIRFAFHVLKISKQKSVDPSELREAKSVVNELDSAPRTCAI
jgi:hypothetical protein